MENFYKRISSDEMEDYIGKNVEIIGRILNTEEYRIRIKINDKIINIENFNIKNANNINVDNLIEIRGEVVNSSTIYSKSYNTPPDNNFNIETFEKILLELNKIIKI